MPKDGRELGLTTGREVVGASAPACLKVPQALPDDDRALQPFDAAKLAGFGHWHPHELRHSGASPTLAQGHHYTWCQRSLDTPASQSPRTCTGTPSKGTGGPSPRLPPAPVTGQYHQERTDSHVSTGSPSTTKSRRKAARGCSTAGRTPTAAAGSWPMAATFRRPGRRPRSAL